jgi:DNA-binding NtrC family response regulator
VDALLVEARRRPLASAKDSSGGSKRPYRTFEIGGTSVVVADAAMQRVYTLVGQLAGSHLTVLVHGETGTGKELVANALHHWSPRAAHPFVAVNCAALMESLVDSELFGHEKGSFTGATSSRPGVFERAHGGTVLLDEVGELTPANQAKLLRVLETKRFLRVGGSQDRAIDFRLVSATNRNLEDEVTGGRFRRDLFYRLSAATVWLPPLRERPNELSILAQLFLDEACRAAQQPLNTLTQGAIDALYEYSWPGNIRELKHAMEYVASAVPGSTIEDAHLEHRLAGGLAAATPAPARLRPSTSRRFRPIYEEISEFERKCLADALEETHGNVTRAAALIKMPLRTFQAKMKQFGLSSSESKRGR